MEKVSIIIPAYNVENYIRDSVLSCINQTYGNLEIVVVNDGSTDNTLFVIEECAQKDDRIKVINKVNGGVSKARNVAIDAAKGKYLIFLDGDDRLEEKALEMLLSNKDKKANYLVACGRYLTSVVGGKEKKVCTTANTKSQRIDKKKALLNIGSGKFNFQSACYKLFDKEVIENNQIRFNENYTHGEDGLFVFEYLRNVDGVDYISDPLWNIYARSGSASRSPYNSRTMTAISAVEDMISKCNETEDELKIALSLFCMDRIETVLGMALSGGIKANREDIVVMRGKLRTYKGLIRKSKVSFLKKEKFYRSAYLPLYCLHLSNVLEKVIRRKAKSIAYSINSRR